MDYDFLHAAIDDATRFAHVEVLPDERRRPITAFLVHGLRWFGEDGVRVERVMTDNASGYVAHFRSSHRRAADNPDGSPSTTTNDIMLASSANAFVGSI